MYTRLRIVLLPLALGLCAAAPRPLPTAWAVIIGINDYEAFGDEPGGDLRGAENDARSFRDVVVRRWGVPPENIRLLLSAEATRGAIEAAIVDWLGTNARPGDLALFFFAGHGSQVLDMDGDEIDGTDETICPFDVDRSSAARDIRDDDLRAWLSRLQTREVVVILDSCHSGTATRIAGYARARSLARPAVDGIGNPDDESERAIRDLITDTTSSLVEIAAASPDQVAMDAAFEGASGGNAGSYYGGAFTTHLVRQLWRAPRGTTYRRIFHETVVALKADGFAQSPQLSGRIQRSAFEPGEAAPLAVTDTVATVVPNAAPSIRAHFSTAIEPEIARRISGMAGIEYVGDSTAVADLYVTLQSDTALLLARDGSRRAALPLREGRIPQADLAFALAHNGLLKQLASLENPQAGYQVEVMLSDGKREFEVGDEITFRITTARAGFLTLLDLGTDGTVSVLHPNEAFDVGRVEAGAVIEIPGPYLATQFNLAPPTGVGLVRAIISDAPLAIPNDSQDLKELRRATERVSAARSGAASWAAGAAVYQIR